MSANDGGEVSLPFPPGSDQVVGLPDRAVTISNSERTQACPLKWWFRYDQGLRLPVRERPLRMGKAWAEVMEDVHRWYASRDEAWPDDAEDVCCWCSGQGCTHCDGSGLGPVARTVREWDRFASAASFEVDFTPSDAEENEVTLRRALEGYFVTYGREPFRKLRVVGAELRLAAPVCNPDTGRPYCPVTWVVEEDDGSVRYARAGEAHTHPEAHTVRWPVYEVGVLDALAEDRRNGSLRVIEQKMVQSPRSYIADLVIDTQMPAYASLLAANLARLGFPGRRISGYLYDVAASVRQRDPKVLKSGKLSKAKNRRVPSWRYHRAVVEGEHDPQEYAEMIAYCADRWDGSLYKRDDDMIGDAEIARHRREIYAAARRTSAWRRASVTAESREEIASRLPRLPVCRLPGAGCSYTGPCVADGEQARKSYQTRPRTLIEVEDEQEDEDELEQLGI